MCIKSDWTEAALPGVPLIIDLNWNTLSIRVKNAASPPAMQHKVWIYSHFPLAAAKSVLQRACLLSNCHKKTKKETGKKGLLCVWCTWR